MPEELVKQFKNPPITEAIFGISFKEPITQDRLELFFNSDFVKAQFPNWTPGVVVELSKSAEKNNLTAVQKSEGFQLRSAVENKRLIQVKPTQLTYHNLTKYDGWEQMLDELKQLWYEFCKSVGWNELSQLSVRYINQIKLPLPFESGIDEYINLLPSFPEGLTTVLNNFFLQISVPLTTPEVQATITETILGVNENDKKMTFLIDLSVVKNGLFKCNESEMWNVFTELRAHKNHLFNFCITEKTKQLFD